MRKALREKARQLFIPSYRSSAAVRYGFAVGAFVVVFLLRLAAEVGLRENSPLVLFTLAVVASSIRGGLGPGLLATGLGAMGALYFFPPAHTFQISPEYRESAIFQLGLFAVAGYVMSWLGSELRRGRWEAEDFGRQRQEILDSITNGFAAFDASGRLLYANRGIKPLIGWDHLPQGATTVWTVFPVLSSSIRRVANESVTLELELFWEQTNRWLEFHVYPSRNGGVTLYVSDITARREAEERLRLTLAERDAALEKVRLLTGFLPVCAGCKKIRDGEGNWSEMESYISGHSEAHFSHTVCPDCYRRLYPDFANDTRN